MELASEETSRAALAQVQQREVSSAGPGICSPQRQRSDGAGRGAGVLVILVEIVA